MRSTLLKYRNAKIIAMIITIVSAIFHFGTPLSANGSVIVKTGKSAILVSVAPKTMLT